MKLISYEVYYFDEKNNYLGEFYFGEDVTGVELTKRAQEVAETLLDQSSEIETVRWVIAKPLETGKVSK